LDGNEIINEQVVKISFQRDACIII